MTHVNMTATEEVRDILVTLLLCEKMNPGEQVKLKQSASLVSKRSHFQENYDFLIFMRRSPNPSGALHREIQKHNLTALYD